MSEDVSPEKAARRTRRRPAEVRQLLLEAAVDVFSSRGHAGASTKVIADTAGVSESTLFRHFSSKDKLFAEAVSQPFERFMQEFVAAWELERAARWDDEAFFHEFVTDLYSNLARNRRLVAALVSTIGDADASEFDRVARDRFRAIFKGLESIGRERAQIGGFKSTHLEMTVRACVAMITGMVVFDPWFRPPGRRGPKSDAMIDEMVAIITYGARERYRPGGPSYPDRAGWSDHARGQA